LAAASVSRKYEVAVFGTDSWAVLLAGAFFAVSVRVLAVFFIVFLQSRRGAVPAKSITHLVRYADPCGRG
jgi:hypothetical protein